jgi:hypothetical protein
MVAVVRRGLGKVGGEISRGTVKIHVQHIISKLGVSDRTQAAVRAIEAGLLGVGTQR